MATSHGSSLRTWRTKSILLALTANESCWTSGESTGWQMLQPNRISPPYWKSQTSTTEIPWSCAPLAWKWACQRFCNVCSYSWEEETRKTENLVTNYIRCLLGDPDNLLNDNQLLEMAQDRHQWRKLVVDCSAAEGWWWWWWWCMRMSAHRTCLLRYFKSCVFGVR